MKLHILQIVKWLRSKMWALIVAYMLGLHNFYNGDNKTPDNIVITIEHHEAQEDGAPDGIR
ncbi:MAG: hypothetical protein WKF87_01850 [Chryseolinea sp.]